MITLKINGHKIKLRTGWDEITIHQWIMLKDSTPLERAIVLTSVRPKLAYLFTDEVLSNINNLTAHFDIHNSMDKIPELITYRKKIGSYYFPEVMTMNGNDTYMHYEQAATYCEAHLALTTTFTHEPRFLSIFCAYYLRGKHEGVTDREVLKRSIAFDTLSMDVALELIYHHLKAFVIIVNNEQYPNLFGKGKGSINGNPLGGLGITSFLHEYAAEKHISVKDIDETIYDLCSHLSVIRTMRK